VLAHVLDLYPISVLPGCTLSQLAGIHGSVLLYPELVPHPCIVYYVSVLPYLGMSHGGPHPELRRMGYKWLIRTFRYWPHTRPRVAIVPKHLGDGLIGPEESD
jgi:hypothetical protein